MIESALQHHKQQRSLATVGSGRYPPATLSILSNVAEQFVQNEKTHTKYMLQRQQQEPNVELAELLQTCDRMIATENEATPVIVTPPMQLLAVPELPVVVKTTKSVPNEKSKALLKKQQQYACTLSSVSLLRTLQKATDTVENGGGGGESNFIMVPLAEQTKYQDQWMKQPSDDLTLEQRESLGILLRKSTKTKMKQQAKLFCRTNQPIEELQRGSLCFIYNELLRTFNPMNLPLISLGPMKCSSALVVLTNVIPEELLKKVFNHLFAVQSDSRKNAAPNSKKKVMSIDELMQTKECGTVFALINEWLWQHLPSREVAAKLKANGSELPLQAYASRLKSQRAEIVVIMKALEENQCQNDCVDSFQKMLLHAQTRCENVNTQLQTQSARIKLVENITQITKMNANLKRKLATTTIADKQQHHQKKTKLIEALPTTALRKANVAQEIRKIRFASLPKQKRKQQGGKSIVAFKKQLELSKVSDENEEGECSTSDSSADDES